mgnify:CR=1 FL=1
MEKLEKFIYSVKYLAPILYFGSVVLIEKLKETRVFSGFTRVNSTNNKSDIKMLSSEEVNWLPAVEVYGEGVFLEFNKEKGYYNEI